MNRFERRQFVRAGASGLATVLVAGCLSDDPGQADPITTEDRDGPTTDRTTTAETTRTQREYGPWSVELENDLDDEVAVTVEIRASAGAVVRNETYDLGPGDAIGPITISDSGEDTATVSTNFATETAEFTACKLNTELHVAIRRTDAGRTLAVTQRHMDPGTGMADEGNLLECDG